MADDDIDPNTDIDPADDADDTDDAVEEPPADWKAKLTAANNDAKRWRLRATGKDTTWKPNTPPPKTEAPKPKDGDQPSADDIRAAVRAELDAEYATKADKHNLRGAVALALTTAGLALSDDELQSPVSARKAVNRVVNMVDMDSLTLDPTTGDVAGLDDELEALKKSYPGMFRQGGTTGTGRSKTRGADGARRAGGAGGKTDEDPVYEMVKHWFPKA